MATRKGGGNIAYECPHLPTCFDHTSKGKRCQDCNALNLTGVRKHTLNTKRHKFCNPACPVYRLTDLSHVKFSRKRAAEKIDLPVQSTSTRIPSCERSSSPSPLARKTSRNQRQRESPSDDDSRADSHFRPRPVHKTSTRTPIHDEFPCKGAMIKNSEKVTFLDSHQGSSKSSSSARETSQESDTAIPSTSSRIVFRKHVTSEASPAFPSLHYDQLDKLSTRSIDPDSNRREAFSEAQNLKAPNIPVAEFSSLDPVLPIKNSRYDESFRLDWKLGVLLVAFLFNLFWFIKACLDGS